MTTETLDTSATQSTDSTASTPVADTTLLSGTEAQATTTASADNPTETQATTPESADGSTTENQSQAEVAPEKYEFKAPEGTNLDASVIDAYSEVAKELNLSQEKAQKVIDKVAPLIQARQIEQVNQASIKWSEEAKADKEFGGDKFAENMSVTKKAYDQFASPALKQMLEETKLGNNPEVIRMFYQVGKAMSEDTFIGGSPKGAKDQGEVNYAKSLYPNQS